MIHHPKPLVVALALGAFIFFVGFAISWTNVFSPTVATETQPVETTKPREYVDISQTAQVFSGKQDWEVFSSKAGGVSFVHPADVKISEKAYFGDNKTVVRIVAERDGTQLFEINILPSYPGEPGGSTFDGATGVLKLSDGTYLARITDSSGGSYRPILVGEKNNVGQLFNSSVSTNDKYGKQYSVFTFLKSEQDLALVDEIISSIQYSDASLGAGIPIAESLASLDNILTFRVVGTVATTTDIKGTDSIKERLYKIVLVDSSRYEASYISLALYPYGSVSLDRIGGFDAEKGMCSGDPEKPLQKIGENMGCYGAWADAGSGGQWYYLVSPDKKYVLKISQGGEVSDRIYLGGSFETAAKSVRFTGK